MNTGAEMTKEEMQELKNHSLDFIRRVASADGTKTDAEVAVLPEMIATTFQYCSPWGTEADLSSEE